jgi:glycosyltransferase involved in cell wall biosynthesis
MEGVPVRRFRYGSDALETLAYRGDLGRLKLAGPRGISAHSRFFLSFARAAKAAVAEGGPKVIHAHWWIPAGWVARGLDFPGRLIVTLHGTDLRLLQSKRWLRPLAARVFARAAVVSVVSTWLADFLCRTYPGVAGRIHVVPMPPNDEVFMRGPAKVSTGTPPVMLAVTRFTAQKRNDLLIETLARLSREGVIFSARLIGEGPLRSQVQARAGQLGLGNVVEFVDPVPQADLANEYRMADLVVLPAVDEGFGMALLEAQLCGTAAIGVRSGGLTDIVEDGRTGLLARPDDPDDLARVLKRAMMDAVLRQALADAGHTSAIQRFSSAAIISQFCQWYAGGP